MNKIKISPYPKYTEKTNLALAIAIHDLNLIENKLESFLTGIDER